MAVRVDQPVSPPRVSLWRRLSKRDTIPKIISSDLLRKSPTTEGMDTSKPTKLRRREARVYKDAPDASPARKASLQLPISTKTTSSPPLSSPISPASPSSPNIEKRPQIPTPQKPTTEPLPLQPETKQPPKPQKKEKVSILQVQRIHVPEARMKPRVVSLHRVLPNEIPTSPFPDSLQVRTVSWNVFLRPEQVYNLVMGYSPDNTDDKWFVYSQGPDKTGKLKVHFHRRWTGMKIAELFVVVDLKGEGAGTIVGVKWNGSAQTNLMDEDEAKYMVSTTCSWVLGVDLENGLFPAMQFE
ncbi:unnamed protein product [Periconia digitata]|uniref:Uncharacterized protein n=1 Tax=Periconia digitata TaxID=1303443 RepID=A0A9W4UFN5_9PLEO|nr:unnamed protein product [Periconia digitata]